MKKTKYCILLIDTRQEELNIVVAIDEDLQTHLVDTEEEAIEFIKYEYCKGYELFGLVGGCQEAFKKLKAQVKKAKGAK